MLKAIWGLVALLEKIFDSFERISTRKYQARVAKRQAKAENYDKLQRALKARKRAVGFILLASCQTINTAVMNETDWICSAFSPISWSINDTLETRMQIYENNAVWEEFCGVGSEVGGHDGE